MPTGCVSCSGLLGATVTEAGETIAALVCVMADTKASILITISSIVMTIALSRASDPQLRPALLTLAAACLIALEDGPAKLPEDHRNARFVAEGLARLPGVKLDPRQVATNIVVFDVSETGIATAELSRQLKRRGVLMNGINEKQMRAVTHYDVTREDCAQALKAVSATIAAAMAAPHAS